MAKRPKDSAPADKSPEDKIVDEAKKRFKRCEDYEMRARERWLEDKKFANGDSDNFWQWEDALRQDRELAQAPCLTVNKVRQHNLQIINDARQNKPSVSVKAVGNGATFEAAEVFEGVIRHIEYVSNAQAAYDTATTDQVEAGMGYWRLVTDYADADSFDQEIFIRRVKNPLSIYLDPDIKELDGSDAQFGFAFDDIPQDIFDKKFPKYKDYASRTALGNAGDINWLSSEKIRVAEYFVREEVKDRLVAMMGNDGQQIIARTSKLPKEAIDGAVDLPDTKFRDITEHKVMRYLIIGDRLVPEETREWPGKYIPIVRVVGEEIDLEGEMDRRGHTRAMKDPQRIYNYWTSSAVEMVALQSKTPYIGSMAAFENLESYWDSANRVNHAWLPYNAFDDKGQPLPAPARQQPPVMASAYMQGMSVASNELQAVAGQFQSEMGMPGNEVSGVAIMQRQRQGDNATYHYIDHLAAAIRYTGKQLIDLIPKIYDTPRIIKILAEDGVETEVEIDPNAKASYLQKQQQEAETVKAIFNPSVGRYDVEADIGPAYATRRQEAFNAFTQLASKNPKIMEVAGDLMFKAADFPMADELAERFKRMIPPNILGEAPPPQMEQMQQQMGMLQGALQKALQSLAEEKRLRIEEAQQKEIDVYKASTDRIAALLKNGIMPGPDVSSDLDPVVAASQSIVVPAAQAGQMAEQQQALDTLRQTVGAEQAPMQSGMAPMAAPDMMATGQ